MPESLAVGLLREERPAKLEAGSGEGKDENQAIFRSQDSSMCFCPCLTASVRKWGRTEAGLAAKLGWGAPNVKPPAPPRLALRQNHFRYPEMGVSGCWMHSVALRGPCPTQGLILGSRALTWHAPGHQQQQWHLHLSQGLSEGRTGQPYTWAPRPYFVKETQNPRDSCTV